MKSIELIQSRNLEPLRKKRVAAYCRVSKDTERLQHSLSSQISYYNRKIQENPSWELAGVFSDEGISGTNIKRDGFKALLEECEKGNIDIILTKSISRFSRNTLDLLNTTRHLKELGIAVIFEKENINTLSQDGELMLTFLASFAQEEIRNISDNIKWRFNKKRKEGKTHSHYRVYGYRWKGDDLVIEPHEAEIVRRIYRECLDGYGMPYIAKRLNDEKVKTVLGGKWRPSTLSIILKNNIYIGDLTLQKVFNITFKKKKANDGYLPKYIIENNHPAIIDRETFQKVQEILKAKYKKGGDKHFPWSKNKNIFDNLVYCSDCDLPLMFATQKAKKENHSPTEMWICRSRSYMKEHKCSLEILQHHALVKATKFVLNTDELSEEILKRKIDKIVFHHGKIIEFILKDGRIIKVKYKLLTGGRKKDCSLKIIEDKIWKEEYRSLPQQKVLRETM